jgi:20S proteasome alpha/beta subunit
MSDSIKLTGKFVLRSPSPAITIPTMTVGISLICEGGKAVVLAADRMTWLDPGGLQLEADTKKIVTLSRSIAATLTGVTSDQQLAMDDFRAIASPSRKTTVSRAARTLKNVLAKIRLDQVEHTYLYRNLGLTLKKFQRMMRKSGGGLATTIYSMMASHNLELKMLVGGVDPTGAHIFIVTDNEAVEWDATGFAAIGISAVQAMAALSRRRPLRSHTLPEAVYDVFEAKRTAESAKGVGRETDIAIVRNGEAVKFLTPESIAALEEIYQSLRPRAISSQHKAEIEKLLPAS